MQHIHDLLLTLTICSSVVLSRHIVSACRGNIHAADTQILGMDTDTKYCQKQPAIQLGSHFMMAAKSTPAACRLEEVVLSSKVSLPNKSRIEGGLLVQQWQHRWEVVQDEAGLVVSCCAEQLHCCFAHMPAPPNSLYTRN